MKVGFLRIAQISQMAMIAALGARVPPWIRVSRCGQLRSEGDLDAAFECYRELLDIARTEGDPLLQIGSYRNRAELLLEGHRYAEAQPLIEAALDISVRLGETWNRTELTAELALAVAGQGDIARAGQLLDAARSLARPSDKFAMATVRFREAGVLGVAGRDREAVDKYREAITQFSHGEWRTGSDRRPTKNGGVSGHWTFPIELTLSPENVSLAE